MILQLKTSVTLDPICKNNPPTFAGLYEDKSAAASSEKRKILHSDQSILCCLVMVYEARCEVNMQEILQHELMLLALSLTETNHTIRTGNN